MLHKQITKKLAALFCGSFMLLNVAQSQVFDFTVSNYTWDNTPVNYQPDTADKAYPMVYLLMSKNNVYSYNELKKGYEQFFVSHTIVYLNEDKAVEDNNKVYIPVYQSQSLVSIDVRVIDKGKVTYEANAKDFIKVEEDGKEYNMIALKGLAKGQVVEKIVKTRLDFDLNGEDYFQFDYPVKKAHFLLISPKELEFRCKSYNGFAPIKDSINDGLSYSYATSTNVAAVNEDEKYAYLSANKMRVEYTYYQNRESLKKYAKWPELGRMYFDQVYNGYDKNQKELDKLLSKIGVDKLKTDEEKFFAIENYLKTNISIEKTAQSTGDLSAEIKRKYTTPYSFNLIMAQCLRKSGITFEMVLTCSREYKKFDADFDSWSYLKALLFYLPSTATYIDPQEPLKRAGSIDPTYLGQKGLFIKFIQIGDAVSAVANVKQIAAPASSSNIDREVYTATLNGEMDKMTIDYHREMNNYADQNLRALYYIFTDDKKKELVEGFVKGMAADATVSDIKVENYNMTNISELKKPFTINAKVSSGHYIESAGDKYLIKMGELIGQQVEMYQEKPRQFGIDIPYTHHYHRTLVLNIPAGYKVKGADKFNINLAYNNESGKPSYGFTSSYKIEGGKLTVECNEYYNDITYPLSVFATYQKVINAAADFNKISVLLEKE